MIGWVEYRYYVKQSKTKDTNNLFPTKLAVLKKRYNSWRKMMDIVFCHKKAQTAQRVNESMSSKKWRIFGIPRMMWQLKKVVLLLFEILRSSGMENASSKQYYHDWLSEDRCKFWLLYRRFCIQAIVCIGSHFRRLLSVNFRKGSKGISLIDLPIRFYDKQATKE